MAGLLFLLLTGCGGPSETASDLGSKVELVESATETFANQMLDLTDAMRRDETDVIAASFAPRIDAIPLPQNATPLQSEHAWISNHGWELADNLSPMSRSDFTASLVKFLAHYSKVEDLRLKIKKSRVDSAGQNIEAELAIFLVAQDRAGRREWTRGRISVKAARIDENPFEIEHFAVTDLASQIASEDLFDEVGLNAGVTRTAPAFLARRDPSFAAYGAAAGDVDDDGALDLVVTSERGITLYLNSGDGTFVDMSEDSLVGSVPGDVVAPLLLDHDNDGDLDLFVSAIGTQKLLENRLVPDRELRFWDVSLEAGVARKAIGFSAVAGDVDGNGFPDVYVASYNRYGEVLPDRWDGATNGTPNLLFLNRGDGSFAENASIWGVADGRWSYAAAFADIDSDGDLDIYSANDFGGGNALFINIGGTFEDRAEAHGVRDGGYGMGVSFGDYDNDGDLDLHVTRMSSTAGRRILARLGDADLPTRDRLEQMAEGNALYQNTGGGTFCDVSETAGPFGAGWAWGGGFADFDNDGFDDIYTPNGFISGSRLHDT